MTHAAQASGQSGEEAARLFAEARGFRTLARNVRTPYGEIDLVLEDRRGTLVFAEVKLRRGPDFGEGSAAVTRSKQKRLRRAGLACAAALGRTDAALRFDVFSIDAGAVDHIVDAF